MKKIIFIAVAIAGFCFALFLLLTQPSDKKPTIIIMSIDTLRADHLGCYGYERGTSPNIDAFAKDAVLFQHAISQAPVTAPSHMSLFTGLLPPVHGVSNWDPNDARSIKRPGSGISTLAEILRNQGYQTAGYHQKGNVASVFGFDRGFDLYTHRGIHWLGAFRDPQGLREIRLWLRKSRKEEKPLFLFLHHYLVHEPYVKAPESIKRRFVDNRPEGLPYSRKDIRGEGDDNKRFWQNIDLRKEDHREYVISLYDSGVYFADLLFGKVLDILKEEQAYDDAMIILLSDHGEEFMEHGHRSHGRLFIENLHVPLVIKFPGERFVGRRIDTPVRMFDVMPTILDWTGFEAPHALQAVTLMPVIRGESDSIDRRIISFHNNLRDIRFDEKEWIYTNQNNFGVDRWLFNPEDDPGEQVNLFGQYRDLVIQLERLARLILDRQRKLRDKLMGDPLASAEPDQELIQQLKTLGYL